MLARFAPVCLLVPVALGQTTDLVSGLPGGNFSTCYHVSLSGDGELASFFSYGSSLGDPAGTYLWHRSTGQVELIGPDGSGPSEVARGGSHVVWTTAFDSLYQGSVYLHDVAAGTSVEVSVDAQGQSLAGRNSQPSVSADGRWVTFISNQAGSAPGHPGVVRHVVLRDMLSGTSELVSVRPDGAPANGPSDQVSVSADGNTVAFLSLASDIDPGDAPNTWNVFVRDRAAGVTLRLGTGYSFTQPKVSADGRYVAYSTGFADAPDDVNGAVDAYVFDAATGAYEVASIDPSTGQPGHGHSVAISPHGRYVAFTGSMYLPGNTSASGGVWLRDRVLGVTEFLSYSYLGTTTTGFSQGNHAISDDARFVAFTWSASLVPEDQDSTSDAYLRDRLEQGLGVAFCAPAVPNSSGASAIATATGSASPDDGLFALTATELPADQPGYFLMSTQTGTTNNPAGAQGTLCLAGTIGRLREQLQSSGPAGVIQVPVDLLDLPPPLQPAVLSGETWAFQCWFRDQNPGTTSNFTDATIVSFH